MATSFTYCFTFGQNLKCSEHFLHLLLLGRTTFDSCFCLRCFNFSVCSIQKKILWQMQLAQRKYRTCFIFYGIGNLSNFAVVKSLLKFGGFLVDNITFFF